MKKSRPKCVGGAYLVTRKQSRKPPLGRTRRKVLNASVPPQRVFHNFHTFTFNNPSNNINTKLKNGKLVARTYVN